MVTETGTADDVIWARQAIDALLELKQAADAARAAGHDVIDAEILEKHGRWFRDAALAARREARSDNHANFDHPDLIVITDVTGGAHQAPLFDWPTAARCEHQIGVPLGAAECPPVGRQRTAATAR